MNTQAILNLEYRAWREQDARGVLIVIVRYSRFGDAEYVACVLVFVRGDGGGGEGMLTVGCC
jgi:hypothetical protein